jgi:hypothetical protein
VFTATEMRAALKLIDERWELKAENSMLKDSARKWEQIAKERGDQIDRLIEKLAEMEELYAKELDDE